MSVIPAPIMHRDLEPTWIDGYAKIPFLQSCLWHSKAYDKYTIALDFDEIMMITGMYCITERRML